MTTRTTTARKTAAKRAPAKKATTVEVVPAEIDTTDADLELDDEDEFPEIPEELRFDTINEDAELEEVTVVFNDPDSGPFPVVIKQPTLAFMAIHMPKFFYPGSQEHEHIAGMLGILHQCLDDRGARYIDTKLRERGANLDPELPGKLVDFIMKKWTPELSGQVERAKNRAQRRARR